MLLFPKHKQAASSQALLYLWPGSWFPRRWLRGAVTSLGDEGRSRRWQLRFEGMLFWRPVRLQGPPGKGWGSIQAGLGAWITGLSSSPGTGPCSVSPWDAEPQGSLCMSYVPAPGRKGPKNPLWAVLGVWDTVL